MNDAQLSGLQRCASAGAKSIAAGVAAGFSAFAICALDFLGSDPPNAKVPGLGVTLPAPLSVLALTVISSASGWVGLAFLVQGLKILRELDNPPGKQSDQIRAALAGSSLVCSTLSFRGLCLAGSLALIVEFSTDFWVVKMMLLSVLLHSRLFANLLVFSVWGQRFLIAPYIYLAFCVWIRWFNPGTWYCLPAWFSWSLWKWLHHKDLASLEGARTWYDSQVNAIPMQEKLKRLREKWLNDLDIKQMDEIGEEVALAVIRQRGFWSFCFAHCDYGSYFQGAVLRRFQKFEQSEMSSFTPEERDEFRHALQM
ncbi:hypothetical protein DYQ86_03970 [Acidobacteria bacterium AB60]|nr:hypothetical protein DYQ86_03970 [Acidobacteria bacterium AB60]